MDFILHSTTLIDNELSIDIHSSTSFGHSSQLLHQMVNHNKRLHWRIDFHYQNVWNQHPTTPGNVHEPLDNLSLFKNESFLRFRIYSRMRVSWEFEFIQEWEFHENLSLFKNASSLRIRVFSWMKSLILFFFDTLFIID